MKGVINLAILIGGSGVGVVIAVFGTPGSDFNDGDEGE